MSLTNISQSLRLYRPDGLNESQWALARPTAIDAVMRTGVTSSEQAKKLLSRLGVFLAWHSAWDRSSTPDLAVLMAPKYLDAFVASLRPDRSTRPYLRKVARAVGALSPTDELASQRVRPVAVEFWTKVVEHGPLVALVAAYRRSGHSFMVATFGGFVERLTGPEWDLARLIRPEPSSRNSTDAFPEMELLGVASRALRLAPDVITTKRVAVTKTPVTKPTKPLSRTAILRAAKAAQAVRTAAQAERLTGRVVEPGLAELPVLEPAISAAITAFRPYRFGEGEWELVRDATRHLAHAYAPTSVEWTHTQMGVLARFCLWVTKRPARANSTDVLRVVELLGAGLIEEYLAGPLATAPDGTRATVRSKLRRGVKRLAPDLAGPVISYQPVKGPYSSFECASLVRLARNQPTSVTRRGVSSIVALGLGAGLSPQEQKAVTPQHVLEIDMGDGELALFVEVEGPRARTVVVRAEYEELLREVLALHKKEGRRCSSPLYGKSVTRHNVTTSVTRRAKTALGMGIELDAARLRSTWLVACMSAPVPLGALLRASGLRSARSLVDLVGYCPEPDEAQVVAVLRTIGTPDLGGRS